MRFSRLSFFALPPIAGKFWIRKFRWCAVVGFEYNLTNWLINNHASRSASSQHVAWPANGFARPA
jgi:hypothetical protein